MQKRYAISAVLLFGLVITVPARAADLAELKILYVGNERIADYVDFLQGKVAKIEAILRKDFKVQDSAAFDVVLLDWPQGEENREMRKLTSPLGSREQWVKPTVLLGSAGLTGNRVSLVPRRDFYDGESKVRAWSRRKAFGRREPG